MEYERSEGTSVICTADLRGGEAGGVHRRERIAEKMGRKEQKQPQARRDSSSDLCSGLHGDQGDTTATTDQAAADPQTGSEAVHGSAWTTIPSEPTMSEQEATIVVACLEVPMMRNIFDGYYSERVDCRLDSVQKTALRHLQFGLQSRYARLRNGKEVANGQDAIKWLLENLNTD